MLACVDLLDLSILGKMNYICMTMWQRNERTLLPGPTMHVSSFRSPVHHGVVAAAVVRNNAEPMDHGTLEQVWLHRNAICAAAERGILAAQDRAGLDERERRPDSI
jgi:hypothetical protein